MPLLEPANCSTYNRDAHTVPLASPVLLRLDVLPEIRTGRASGTLPMGIRYFTARNCSSFALSSALIAECASLAARLVSSSGSV